MQITLKQDDIEQAIKDYLSNQGIVLFNRSFEATFRAGRKGSGLSAAIRIGLPTEPMLTDVLGSATVEATVIKAEEPVEVDSLIPVSQAVAPPVFTEEEDPVTTTSSVTDVFKEEPVAQPEEPTTPVKTPSLFS